jgi:hypothetical protein
MTDDLDSREAERVRRRDREAAAAQRELMRPGMGKVFKQIGDAQEKAAKTGKAAKPASHRPKRKRGDG